MGFVDRPQILRWRKALFQVRLCAGIVLALYVVAISVSGSILVFERNVEDNAPPLHPRVGASVMYQRIWEDRSSGRLRVKLSFSSDERKTWSHPRVLDDDIAMHAGDTIRGHDDNHGVVAVNT